MKIEPIYQYKNNIIAPISVCLIVKNEQVYLEKCLQSIRPYVKEIVIVDTGSTDQSPDIAKKYADIFEIFTECNDENGLIEDFSLAREKSFSLATQPWILWIDADDEVIGAENLFNLTEEYNDYDVCIGFPYQYAFDEFGKCICLHYRERLIKNKDNYKWINPVHEVLIPKDGNLKLEIRENVIIKHNRNVLKKPIEFNRNLRILQKYYDKHGEKDVRQLYYLGLEYGNTGNINESIKFLNRYLELSGWDDEKYMALLRLVEYYLKMGCYSEVLEHCWKAIQIKPNWGEAYFNLAKAHYFLAQKGEESNKNWEKCIIYANIGLNLPPTKTLLFINPLERQIEIHKYLNVALFNTGKTEEALQSVLSGLEFSPNEPLLLNNKNYYENILLKNKFVNLSFQLEQNKIITENQKDVILSVLENQAISYEIDNLSDQNIISQINYENNDLFGSAITLNNNIVLNFYKLIWKQLLLHDEVINAGKLLESVPWQIRDHSDILWMKNFMKSHLENIFNKERYIKHYSNYATDKESFPLPLEFEKHHTQFERYQYVLNFFKTKNEKLNYLDIGSHDGWLTNRLGLYYSNLNIYGVEASNNGACLANKKAEEFKINANHCKIIFGEEKLPINFPSKFDVISALEIYEHVPNTVEFLKQISDYLKDDGYLLLSTPKGSWCQGKEVSYHPTWNSQEFKEHIRAPIKIDLEQDLELAGLQIIDYQELKIDQSALPNEYKIENQTSICLTAKKIIKNKLDTIKNIVFFVGPSVEPWNSETAKINGIGGSETAVIEISERFAKQGYNVTIYGDCIRPNLNLEGTFNNVKYYHYKKFNNVNCDIFITSRNPVSVDDIYNCTAKYKYCWVHDIHCGNSLTFDRYTKINKFLCLTDWHRNFFINSYPFMDPNKVIKTRNGINLERFDKKIERNMHRAIYSSSPDRGMEVAVRNWKRVREQIPDAELHIFYGFQTWEKGADPGQQELIKKLKQLLKDNEQYGVYYHGRVDQETLTEEMLKSNVWAYSTWFSETSCQLKGSLIFTKHGMKPIEDIQIGDLVLTHKGRFRKVTKLIKKDYNGYLYSLQRKKDCNPITLTEEHPIYTAEFHTRSDAKGKRVGKLENKSLFWKTPDQLKENLNFGITPKIKFGNLDKIKISDYINFTVKDEWISSNHNNSRYKKVKNEQILTNEFCYLLGLFAAEGCVANVKSRKNKNNEYHYSTITYALNIKEINLANKIINFFGGKWKKISENGIIVNSYNSVWANFLKKTIGTGINKKIPDFIWDCSKEKQLSFLQGLFDGDGCQPIHKKPKGRTKTIYKSYSSYTSISPSLAYGMSQLLINQGYFPSIFYDKQRKAYSLTWTTEPKSCQHWQIEEGFVTKINKIEKSFYNGTVYNFEVEEDESYVTDRTVVHNCITAMESHAAGLHMITSPIAALNETVGDRGVLIPGDWLSEEYANKFVEEVVKAMKNPMTTEERNKLQQYAKDNFSWDDVVENWKIMFEKDIKNKSEDIVEPYKPIL